MMPPENLGSEESPVPPAGQGQAWRGALAALLLAATAVLTAHTVWAARRVEDVNAPPPVQSYRDAAERTARVRDVLGRFATGAEPGDRVIVVLADGRVRFELIGPLERPLEFSDTYTVGRREDHTCLVTRESGVIDAGDIDHLSFCGNIFERVK
jgi:hypothetical protein